MSVWERLKSPVIFRGDDKTAFRDPAVIYEAGWFHLFFTLVETEEDGTVYMYTAKSMSRDLVDWSTPRKLTKRDRSCNFSSPGNVVKYQDRFWLCLQTYCRENGEKYGNGRSRIYVMESCDLEHFTEPRLLKLKGDIPEADMGRMIDPYLLEDQQTPGKWWCFYKQNGVSMSYSYDMEHWTYAGHRKAGENVCVIPRDGMYYMFHSPENGIGVLESTDCMEWNDTGTLITLSQDTWEWARGRLTAGVVLDATGIDGFNCYLMFFHGSGPEDETTMFDQYASIGMAWSVDFVNWEWVK